MSTLMVGLLSVPPPRPHHPAALCYAAQLEVCDGAGRTLFAERAFVEPAAHSPATPGVLGAYPVAGSLHLLAPGLNIEARLACATDVLHLHRDVMADAGALPNGCGLLVRALPSGRADTKAAVYCTNSLFTSQVF